MKLNTQNYRPILLLGIQCRAFLDTYLSQLKTDFQFSFLNDLEDLEEKLMITVGPFLLLTCYHEYQKNRLRLLQLKALHGLEIVLCFKRSEANVAFETVADRLPFHIVENVTTSEIERTLRTALAWVHSKSKLETHHVFPFAYESLKALGELKRIVSEYEKRLLQSALKYFDGNRKETANALGIHINTLLLKIKRYNLDIEKPIEHFDFESLPPPTV